LPTSDGITDSTAAQNSSEITPIRVTGQSSPVSAFKFGRHALGGYQAAVARMNARAVALGARNTHASSPSGLDGPGMESTTTPFDLAVIYRAALRYPAFAAIVRQPSSLFPTDDGPREIVNQNQLLKRYPGTLVGKTGFTNLAQHTFVGAAQRNGHGLVVVQMYGSGDMYGQAIGLLDWGFSQYG
jgi:D-alanyl-D-alanine carboxypeptidase (penicillin-binding protein 5/6)